MPLGVCTMLASHTLAIGVVVLLSCSRRPLQTLPTRTRSKKSPCNFCSSHREVGTEESPKTCGGARIKSQVISAKAHTLEWSNDLVSSLARVGARAGLEAVVCFPHAVRCDQCTRMIRLRAARDLVFGVSKPKTTFM